MLSLGRLARSGRGQVALASQLSHLDRRAYCAPRGDPRPPRYLPDDPRKVALDALTARLVPLLCAEGARKPGNYPKEAIVGSLMALNKLGLSEETFMRRLIMEAAGMVDEFDERDIAEVLIALDRMQHKDAKFVELLANESRATVRSPRSIYDVVTALQSLRHTDESLLSHFDTILTHHINVFDFELAPNEESINTVRYLAEAAEALKQARNEDAPRSAGQCVVLDTNVLLKDMCPLQDIARLPQPDWDIVVPRRVLSELVGLTKTTNPGVMQRAQNALYKITEYCLNESLNFRVGSQREEDHSLGLPDDVILSVCESMLQRGSTVHFITLDNEAASKAIAKGCSSSGVLAFLLKHQSHMEHGRNSTSVE